MHRWDSVSSHACAKSHPGICSPSIHSIVSNDSVVGQRRPWSDSPSSFPADLTKAVPTLQFRPKAAVFNTSQGTWWMLMHWKTMFNRYYCIKIVNICYILRYILHYFVSPFHRCRANAISTHCACSKAEQYTSRDSSNSVAPVRAYWKLHSRALTARELPC